MYNFENNNFYNETPENRYSYYEPEPQKKRKKSGFFKKATALVLGAVLFGSVAGGTFYEVNGILTDSAQTEQSEVSSVSDGTVSGISTLSSSGQSLDVSEIAEMGLTSVVSVTNISVQEVENYFGRFGRNGQSQTQLEETTSCGSGIIICNNGSELYMVTNYHVVEGATTLSVTFVNEETCEAELCGYDETMDLAVIKVYVSELSDETLSQISVVTVGDSDECVVGEQVVAIGNALGYGQSVTTGIISATNRTISDDSSSSVYLQTDAAINPGNSGGALLNMNGELIGINTAKISSTGIEGMGYAIPISEVTELIESFIGE